MLFRKEIKVISIIIGIIGIKDEIKDNSKEAIKLLKNESI